MNEDTRGKCFVMQHFDDGGQFDKRYDQVLTPAIHDAGLEAYRVDRDPSSAVPIDDIEDGIRKSKVCLADITTRNVNVSFELGYALALNKRVVLIGKKGTDLPFNFRHRKVILYDTEAPDDFLAFRSEVSAALVSAIEKAEQTEQIADALQPTGGLKAHEVAALAALAQIVDGATEGASTLSIREVMQRMGYNGTATRLALTVLHRKGMVSERREQDYNGDTYSVYRLEDAGMEWLLSNQDHLDLRTEMPTQSDNFGDIPF